MDPGGESRVLARAYMAAPSTDGGAADVGGSGGAQAPPPDRLPAGGVAASTAVVAEPRWASMAVVAEHGGAAMAVVAAAARAPVVLVEYARDSAVLAMARSLVGNPLGEAWSQTRARFLSAGAPAAAAGVVVGGGSEGGPDLLFAVETADVQRAGRNVGRGAGDPGAAARAAEAESAAPPAAALRPPPPLPPARLLYRTLPAATEARRAVAAAIALAVAPLRDALDTPDAPARVLAAVRSARAAASRAFDDRAATAEAPWPPAEFVEMLRRAAVHNRRLAVAAKKGRAGHYKKKDFGRSERPYEAWRAATSAAYDASAVALSRRADELAETVLGQVGQAIGQVGQAIAAPVCWLQRCCPGSGAAGAGGAASLPGGRRGNKVLAYASDEDIQDAGAPPPAAGALGRGISATSAEGDGGVSPAVGHAMIRQSSETMAVGTATPPRLLLFVVVKVLLQGGRCIAAPAGVPV